MCPVCLAVIGSTEQEVLAHLLARHPLALALLTGALVAANLWLARRPRQLLVFEVGVSVAAVAISRGPSRNR
jgi:hypothetical protein